MGRGKDKTFWIGVLLSTGLICALCSAVLTARFYRQEQFEILGTVCGVLNEKDPEAAQAFLAAWKQYQVRPEAVSAGNFLSDYGYRPSDVSRNVFWYEILFGTAGFLAGGSLFLAAFFYEERRQARRIRELAGYLERVNAGEPELLFPVGEDDCSRLQDEIYKTVTSAHQTRDEALKARRSFADNLSNIAHQLKTPVTSISLSVQMLKERHSQDYLDQISRQLSRLNHLEEALLLMSRMDAGALSLEKKPVDVFTLLCLAADNLQELFSRAGVQAEVLEAGAVQIEGDLEWTMEVVMNLMKNCAEYSPQGGTVYSSYEQNPLYVQIRIWDEGKGFAKQDLPHLFERFYRGGGARETGIGIGLSLAQEIVEMENGTLRAFNLPSGSACFEIRFYCH